MRFCPFALVLLLAMSGHAAETRRTTTVNTVADLLDIGTLVEGQPVTLLGCHRVGDGGGGPLRYTATGGTIDNGLIFAAPGGGTKRFERQWDGSTVDVQWFGARRAGTVVADETARDALSPATGDRVALIDTSRVYEWNGSSWDLVNDQDEFQLALTAAGNVQGTCKVGAGYWQVFTGLTDVDNRLTMLEGTHLAFDKYAVLSQLVDPADAGNGYNFIRPSDNCTVSGGRMVMDRDSAELTGGANGGIRIIGKRNVTIRDMVIEDDWGDSIYVNNSTGSPSTNIKILRVRVNNSRRNNMAIVGTLGCLVEACTFSRANGTSPECGVDIEPNANQVCQNITFRNCHFYGNKGNQLYVQSGASSRNGLGAATSDVTVDNCLFELWPRRLIRFTNSSSSVIIFDHNLLVNDTVKIEEIGNLPAEFLANETYHVKTVVDPNTVILAATQGGAAITPTSDGTEKNYVNSTGTANHGLSTVYAPNITVHVSNADNTRVINSTFNDIRYFGTEVQNAVVANNTFNNQQFVIDGAEGANIHDNSFRLRRAPFCVLDDADDTEDADYTLDISEPSVLNDVQLLPSVPAVGDAIYFGHTEEFVRMYLNTTTAGAGSWVLEWEYWNGAWVALSSDSDDSTSFTVAGWKRIKWAVPGDWAEKNVEGKNAFWVRARVTTGDASPGAVPLATEAWIHRDSEIQTIDISTTAAMPHADDVKFHGNEVYGGLGTKFGTANRLSVSGNVIANAGNYGIILDGAASEDVIIDGNTILRSQIYTIRANKDVTRLGITNNVFNENRSHILYFDTNADDITVANNKSEGSVSFLYFNESYGIADRVTVTGNVCNNLSGYFIECENGQTPTNLVVTGNFPGSPTNGFIDSADIDFTTTTIKNNAPWNGKGPIRPEWFGAIVDDGLDDRLALERAAVVADGKELRLSPGVYDCATTFDIDNNVTVTSEGRSATIRAISGATGKLIHVGTSADGVTIRGIKIDCNGIAQEGVYFGDQCEDGTIDDCEIFGGISETSAAVGVHFTGECHRATVSNNYIHDFDDSIGNNGTVRGILFGNGDPASMDVKIFNNRITRIFDSESDNGGTVDCDGIVLQDWTTKGNVAIYNNHISDCRGRCIKMQVSGSAVTDNVLHSQTGSMWMVSHNGDTLWSGNHCTGFVSDQGIGLFDGDVFQGNTLIFYDNLDTPVALTADAGLDVFTSAGHGLDNREKVQFAGSPLPTGISAATDYFVMNKTEDTFQVAADVPDYLAGTEVDFSDTGTTVTWERGDEQNSDGITMGSHAPRANISIIGNTIVNAPRHAIHILDDVTSLVINDNKIMDAGDDATNGYGINCVGLLDKSVIDGNLFKSNQDQDIAAINGGTYNVISNNVFESAENGMLWLSVDYTHVTGNVFREGINDTLVLQGCDHLTISDNRFTKFNQLGSDQAIRLSGTECTDLRIVGNVFANHPTPVMIFSSSGTSANVEISRNKFEDLTNTANGVFDINAAIDRLKIINNTFHDFTAPIIHNSAALSDVMFNGNIITGSTIVSTNGVLDINSAVTNLQVQGNTIRVAPIPFVKISAASTGIVVSDNVMSGLAAQADDTTGIIELDAGLSDTVIVKNNRASVTGIAATAQNADETLTDENHGLSNDDVVTLTATTIPTGLTAFQRYYVMSSTDDGVGGAADTFQLSLVHSNDVETAVTFSTDGAGITYHAGENFVRNNDNSTRVVVHGNRSPDNSVLNWMNGGITTWNTVYDNFYDMEAQQVDVDYVEYHVVGKSRIELDGQGATILHGLTGGVEGQVIDIHVDSFYALGPNDAAASPNSDFNLSADASFDPASSEGFIRLMYDTSVNGWREILRKTWD